MAFHTVAIAATLAKNLLPTFPSSSVIILMADQYVLSYCQITDHHNNTKAYRAICDSMASILDTHTDMTLFIDWIPGKISFHPLKHLQEITIEAASDAALDLDLSTPTPEALHVLVRNVALLK
jgi:hypothetical protein